MATKNQAWIDRAAAVMPGRQSNARAFLGPSIFIQRGARQWFWDVDGNDYLDFAVAMGPGIWGNANTDYLAPIHEQLDRLLYIQSGALQTPHEVKLAEKIVQHVPSAEYVRFLLAGTEAVQMAIRLARAHTGRERIVRFAGHYHGWLDNVLGGTVNPNPDAVPYPIDDEQDHYYTAGRASRALQECYLIDWNDADRLEQVILRYGHDIAMVMMEPLNSNAGGCSPKPGYLQAVRELCTRHEIVLCFDEVITGFRTALHGAQGMVGVTPDLTIFGKALAGGIPLAAIAGKKALFDPIRARKVIGAGTFNAFPVGMVAALSTIRLLEHDDGAIYRHRDAIQARLESEITECARRYGHDLLIQGSPGVFCAHFTDAEVLWTIAEVTARADLEKALRFRTLLEEEGIFQALGSRHMVSFAMTDEDVDEAVLRMERAFKRL